MYPAQKAQRGGTSMETNRNRVKFEADAITYEPLRFPS